MGGGGGGGGVAYFQILWYHKGQNLVGEKWTNFG